jgi:hypothetical protein
MPRSLPNSSNVSVKLSSGTASRTAHRVKRARFAFNAHLQG